MMLIVRASSEDAEGALALDDTCDTESCSLELKQLRAKKVAVDEQDAQNCMNDKDQLILRGEEQVGHRHFKTIQIDMAMCARECLNKHEGSIKGPCQASCLQRRDSYTAQCTKCFGMLAQCGSTNCEKVCEKEKPCKHSFKKCKAGEKWKTWSYTKSCKSCMKKKCGAEFKSCSGMDKFWGSGKIESNPV